MKLQLLSESANKFHVFHGGSKIHGVVTYYTTSLEMAKSYANMHNDRFGYGDVHDFEITINNPAPERVINTIANNIGIDNGDYTPASIFDANLHGEHEIQQLVKSLKRLGYDGAILMDIGYGVQIEGNAYIVFN